MAALPVLDLNLLSPEKPGIDRTNTRSEHRQSRAKGSKHHTIAQTVSFPKDAPKLNEDNQHARDWRPETDEKQNSGRARDGLPYDSIPRGGTPHPGESVVD